MDKACAFLGTERRQPKLGGIEQADCMATGSALSRRPLHALASHKDYFYLEST